MAENSTNDDEAKGRGCLTIVGSFCISVGIGVIFGEGYGWIAGGVIAFLLVTQSLVCEQRRRRQFPTPRAGG